MPEGFISFCESLWQDWLTGRLETSPFVKQTFDLDAAPEPYISFESGQNPLVALTTNPGKTMPHQRRRSVQAGRGPLSPAIDYEAAAEALGAFYERRLAGRPAGRRIAAIRALSALAGAEGVVQVEVCPFHSRALPNKLGLLQEIGKVGLLRRYVEELRAFLMTRSVLAISTVSSQISIRSGTPLSPWAMWLSELTGPNPKRARFVRLVTKGKKVTAAAFVSSHAGTQRSLVLMMGGNHLPGERGLAILADALRKSI
jgi:hypothetical protein